MIEANKTPVMQTSLDGQNSLTRLKWRLTRTVLSTVGRLSNGVRLGYQHGFDSGTMLDYVYINHSSGRLGIGKLIDRIYLNAVGWRAIRARRELLKTLLHTEIQRNQQHGQITRLLDVAAGPGRYLQELLLENRLTDGKVLRVLCRDLAADGLQRGERAAIEQGLKNIRYEQGDAFQPAPTLDQTQLGGPPNIIVVSGLYELLLDDQTIRRSLARLYQELTPGGLLLFTTQTNHPQLEFIANVLPNRDGQPWLMKCRSVEQVEQWARAAGFSEVASQVEEVGLFAVTGGRKTA